MGNRSLVLGLAFFFVVGFTYSFFFLYFVDFVRFFSKFERF